jgi:PAS domain S-box-containing protein
MGALMLSFFPGEHDAIETHKYIEEKLALGLWTWDLETNAMEWSCGTFCLLGLQPNSVVPHFNVLADMIHPDDLCTPNDPSAAIRELPIGREFRIIWRNGRIRWAVSQGEIVMGSDGRITRAIGVLQDITAQHDEFRKLRAAEERLRALNSALDAPIWIANATTGAITGIHNWGAIAADRSIDVLGEQWIELLHPDDRQAAVEAWNYARLRRGRYENEHRMRQPDGRYRWKHSCAMPVISSAGRIEEYIGVTFDIHASKEMPPMADAEYRLTGAQIRAARAILRWSVRDLADNAKISPATIRRLEEVDGSVRDDSIAPICRTFRSAGVEFFAAGNGKPGVSPR